MRRSFVGRHTKLGLISRRVLVSRSLSSFCCILHGPPLEGLVGGRCQESLRQERGAVLTAAEGLEHVVAALVETWAMHAGLSGPPTCAVAPIRANLDDPNRRRRLQQMRCVHRPTAVCRLPERIQQRSDLPSFSPTK